MIAGCKNKTDDIIGAWKSTEINSMSNKLRTCIIEKDTISSNGNRPSPMKFSEGKDGIVYGKSGEQILVEIKIIDKDRIKMTFPGWFPEKEYVRTTREDVETIIKTPAPKREYRGW